MEVAVKEARVSAAETGLSVAEQTLADMAAGGLATDIDLRLAQAATAEDNLTAAATTLAAMLAGAASIDTDDMAHEQDVVAALQKGKGRRASAVARTLRCVRSHSPTSHEISASRCGHSQDAN